MKKECGWIRLHRKTMNHALFKQPRNFSYLEAWLDILLSANFQDGETYSEKYKRMVSYKRGEWYISEVKLAEKWGWSRGKVRRYIALLKNQEMLKQNSTVDGTVLTVVNYDFYQSDSTAKRTADGTAGGTADGTLNKNIKNDKERIKHYIAAENVKFKPAEYEKLIADYGELAVKRMIEILDNYKGATGKKYASDYRAILNWVVKRYEEEKTKPVQQQPQQNAQIAWEEVRDKLITNFKPNPQWSNRIIAKAVLNTGYLDIRNHGEAMMPKFIKAYNAAVKSEVANEHYK